MKNNNLIKRIKIAGGILLNRKRQIMYCPKCGSINVNPLPESMKEKSGNNKLIDLVHSGISTCRNCGAVCFEKQYWSYREDMSEEDNSSKEN